MRDRTVFWLSGRIAVFVAMAALFLHTSCAIGLTLFTAPETNASTDSGCHQSTPVVPNSGQKCCNGAHLPEALLTTGPTPPMPFISADPISCALCGTGQTPEHVSDIATAAYGPPLPSVLRI